MNTSTILLGLNRFEEFAAVKSITVLKNITPYLLTTLSPDTDLKLLYKEIKREREREVSVISQFLPYIDFYTSLLYWAELNSPEQVEDLLKLEKNPAVLDTVRKKLKIVDTMFQTSLSSKLKERVKNIYKFLKTKNILYFGMSTKDAKQTTSLIDFNAIESFKDLKEKLLNLKGKHIELLIEDIYNLGRIPTIKNYFNTSNGTCRVEIKLFKRKNNYSIKVEPDIKDVKNIEPQIIKEIKKFQINFTVDKHKYVRVGAGQTLNEILDEFLDKFNL